MSFLCTGVAVLLGSFVNGLFSLFVTAFLLAPKLYLTGIALDSKVDVVMWAKNGEALLPTVLARIDKVIPHESVCHRILIDDHSTDRTVEIAKDFNWDVYTNPHGGIPSAANEAFRHVDRDFFVSVEQDIILSREWWDKIPKYMENPSVACAQGIRIFTHPVLHILEEWEYSGPHGKKRYLTSMDNNIFRSKVVRSLGGFPQICPVCTDTVLRKRITYETPYKWVIDTDVVSLHIRRNLKETIDHAYKLNYLCARTPYCSPNQRYSILLLFRLLLTSPLRALQVALKKDCPEMMWAYPLIRWYQLSKDLHWRNQPSLPTIELVQN